MKEQFVPYEQALKLKELGFDEPCFTFWEEGLFENKGKYKLASIIMSTYLNGPYEKEVYGYVHPTDGDRRIFVGYKNSFKDELIGSLIAAPLWQQAFDWFRQHGLTGSMYNHHQNVLDWHWSYVINFDLLTTVDENLAPLHLFETYEEARLACLNKLIELENETRTKTTD